MEFSYGPVIEAMATALFGCASCDLTDDQWIIIDSAISAIAADCHAAADATANEVARQRSKAILDHAASPCCPEVGVLFLAFRLKGRWPGFRLLKWVYINVHGARPRHLTLTILGIFFQQKCLRNTYTLL